MLEIVSPAIIGALALIVFSVVGGRIGGPALQKLLALGVFMRIVGSTVRLEVMDRFYDGGDWRTYFAFGEDYAARLWKLDFSMFDIATEYRWAGTVFVQWVTGFVLAITGPSLRGGFLAFSLLSFTGLVLTGLAFRRSFSTDSNYYLGWLLLWPSLWFWPASIGKDALMVLALGLSAFGYVGTGTQARLVPLSMGLVLAACIRPHVAVLLAASMVIAEWLRRDNLRQRFAWLRGVVLVLIAIFVVYDGLQSFRTEDEVDLLDLQEEFEFRATQTQTGGSRIETTEGLSAVPLAFVNILLRPFPWEAHHGFAFVAAVEIWGLWLLAFGKRTQLMKAVAGWRGNRLLTYALPATLLISLMYGIAFSNLGIIARQRVVVLPFLFLMLGLAGLEKPSSQSARAPPLALPRDGGARKSLSKP